MSASDDKATGRRGLFATIEGVDGAGKSTLVGALTAALEAKGLEVVRTREPGGAPGAEEIRRLLVAGDGARWSPEAELLLFNAARRDHLDRTVEPALARGAVVLCDRYVDSTRAYQAAGRGAPLALVDALHALVIGREADVTLILDLDPARAAERQGEQAPAPEDERRFERFGAAFQETLRSAFLAIAAADPERCRVIDADRPADAVAADALAAIEAALGRKGEGA